MACERGVGGEIITNYENCEQHLDVKCESGTPVDVPGMQEGCKSHVAASSVPLPIPLFVRSKTLVNNIPEYVNNQSHTQQHSSDGGRALSFKERSSLMAFRTR